MTAKQWAGEFVDTFIDQYEEENIDVEAMTEVQAKKFVLEHIEFMCAINGDEYLWGIELMAIKELNLFEILSIEPEYVKDRLLAYA